MRAWLPIPAVLLLACSPAHAHHAKEYLVTGSYETVHAGDQIVTLAHRYSFEEAGDSSTYHGELTPAWGYGLTDLLQAEIHFHVIDPDVEDSEAAGKDGFVEAVTPSLKVRLPRREDWPVDAAFALEAEFATGDGKRAGSQDQIWPHLLLRRFLKNGFETTLDLHGRFEVSGGRDTEWGMALATKRDLNDWLAAGLELEIPADGPAASAVPGIYLEKGAMTAKIGLAIGLAPETADLEVLSSVSYQF